WGSAPLLPSSPKRLVQLDDSQGFIKPYLSKRKFGLKEIAIGIESVELGIHAPAVSDVRKTHSILQRGHESVLLLPALSHFLISDQTIRYLTEGSLNGLLVLHQRLLSPGLGQFYVGLETSSGKDRLRNLGCQVERSAGPVE